MKIAICREYGMGFLLSATAQSMLGDEDFDAPETRGDLRLIETVELLGDDAFVAGGELAEIPDDAYWVIVVDDGAEMLYWSFSPIIRA